MDAERRVAKEDFEAAMSAMAKLRPAVDAFFDKVKVNDDDAKVRENRLKLLNEIRAATRAVADFSRDTGLNFRTQTSRLIRHHTDIAVRPLRSNRRLHQVDWG